MVIRHTSAEGGCDVVAGVDGEMACVFAAAIAAPAAKGRAGVGIGSEGDTAAKEIGGLVGLLGDAAAARTVAVDGDRVGVEAEGGVDALVAVHRQFAS